MDQNQLAVSLFDQHAEDYQQKYFNVELYADSLGVLLSLLEDNATILDVAAGPGNVARYLLDHKPKLKYLLTDLSPRMLELAGKNVPEAEIMLLDCRKMADSGKQFDVILASFCIPYLNHSEVEKLLRDAFAHLKPSGIFYLSFITADRDHTLRNTASSGLVLFQHFYTTSTIEKLLGGNFEILHSTSYLSYNKTDTDSVIIAKRRE